MSNQLAVIREAMPVIQKKFEAVPNSGLDFRREAGFAMQILQNNTFLQGADMGTIQNAIVNVAMTGLSLNPVTKLAYLVPRRINNVLMCVLDISYMGLCKVLTDSGAVKTVYARTVYEKDLFRIVEGSNPALIHEPFIAGEPGNIVGFYSMAILHDGSRVWEWMRKAEVDAIKARSEMGKKDIGSWKTDYEEMGKKTVIKRHYKTLPKSNIKPEVLEAIEFDHQANGIDFAKEKQEANKNKVADLLDDEPVQDAEVIAEPEAAK